MPQRKHSKLSQLLQQQPRSADEVARQRSKDEEERWIPPLKHEKLSQLP
jgi:hypothetical protein